MLSLFDFVQYLQKTLTGIACERVINYNTVRLPYYKVLLGNIKKSYYKEFCKIELNKFSLVLKNVLLNRTFRKLEIRCMEVSPYIVLSGL